jgi:phospholipase A2-like protein
MAGDHRLGRLAAVLAIALTTAQAPAPAPPDAALDYVPIVAQLADGTTRTVKPDGACSVPGGGGPFGFDLACQAHDYGYDQLRRAAAEGRPLGPEARRTFDAWFAHDLHLHCAMTQRDLAAEACHGLAEVYAKGAAFNSWRQQYGPPVPEPMVAWAAGLVLALLVWFAPFGVWFAPSGSRRPWPGGVPRGTRKCPLAGDPLVSLPFGRRLQSPKTAASPAEGATMIRFLEDEAEDMGHETMVNKLLRDLLHR